MFFRSGAIAIAAEPERGSIRESLIRVLPGQYFDAETGTHYNYFRDYDPTIGRYVQGDLLGLAGGLNTFAYVGSAPLSFADPAGLDNPGMGAYGPYWSGPPVAYNGRSGLLGPDMEQQVQCMYLCLANHGGPPERLVVTGGREPRPGSLTSRHPSGQAVDFGAHANPTLTPTAGRRNEMLQCACECGFSHGGWEPEWNVNAADHYHFQNGIGAGVPRLNCNKCPI